MNYKKIYLGLFILILYFNLIFLGSDISFIPQDEKSNGDMRINSSASYSHAYEWHRTWVGNAYSVAIDTMGDVYVAGNDGGYYRNMSLVKYDSSGVYQWNRTWGGSNDVSCRDVAIDSLDNVYMAGTTDDGGIEAEDMVLIKYDSSGVYQWNRTWDGGYDDEGWAIAVDSSDNIYVAGRSVIWEQHANDMLLLKYDSSGIYQWNRTWGGNDNQGCIGLALDSSDNMYLTGYTERSPSDYDMIVVKFDSSGVYEWNSTWGAYNEDREWSYGVALDSLNNVYITGYTERLGINDDMVLVKYDSSGGYQWNRTYGASGIDHSYDIAIDSLDNVYITGEIDGGTIVVLKYDSYGEQKWIIPFTLIGVQGEGITLDSNDNIYVAARQAGTMVLIKYNKIPEVIINSPQQDELFGSNTPTFNVSILEPDLDSMWYTLDNGNTNITFNELTGTINQIEWTKKTSGAVTIQFYAENILGKVGHAEVTVIKDIDKPEITIIIPSQSDVIGDDAPGYEISVVEPHLESMWYTIDGGLTNYTIYQDTGNINQTAWNEAPYGYITISFYGKDLMGYVGFDEIIVEKDSSQFQPVPWEIIIIILSASSLAGISVVTLLIIRRKRKRGK